MSSFNFDPQGLDFGRKLLAGFPSPIIAYNSRRHDDDATSEAHVPCALGPDYLGYTMGEGHDGLPHGDNREH